MNTQDKIDVMLEAKRLLQEVGWTKGVFARNLYGEQVGWGSPDAVCYCANGAIFKAQRNLGFDTNAYFPQQFSQFINTAASIWNDSRHTVEEVLKEFDNFIHWLRYNG